MQCGIPSGIATPELDRTFCMEWRTNVEKNILQINKRLSALEKEYQELRVKEHKWASEQNCFNTKEIEKLFSAEEVEPVDSFATADYKGKWCFSTFTTIAKSKRDAQLQIIYLITCLIIVLYYGIDSFYEAKENEEAYFKPEKKKYVQNYAIADENYTVPYISFYWYISANDINESSSMNQTKLADQLLESQGSFSNSVRYIYHGNGSGHDKFTEFPDTAATVYIDSRLGSAANGFWGVFKLEVSHPDPVNGIWTMAILLDIEAMFLDGSVTLEYLWLTVTRDEIGWMDDGMIPLSWDITTDNETIHMFMTRWDETVTQMHKSELFYHDIVEYLESESIVSIHLLNVTEGIAADSSDICILLEPDLEVEHWGQYVAFGYFQWLTGMGGLLSLMTTTFFLVSYYTTAFLGSGISMGILPCLSFNFSSYEDVHWIKNKLRQLG